MTKWEYRVEQKEYAPPNMLQTWLNNLGNQGWNLIFLFPVGTTYMYIFRHPKD